MWSKKIIRVIPEILFLFCLLGFFELVLIVMSMNKSEKLEVQLTQNLKVLEEIANLLNEHLEGMGALEHLQK